MQYIVTVSKGDTNALTLQQKNPRLGEFLEHEGNQKDYWLSLSL